MLLNCAICKSSSLTDKRRGGTSVMSTKDKKELVRCFVCDGVGKIQKSTGHAGQEMCGWVNTGNHWEVCSACKGKKRIKIDKISSDDLEVLEWKLYNARVTKEQYLKSKRQLRLWMEALLALVRT